VAQQTNRLNLAPAAGLAQGLDLHPGPCTRPVHHKCINGAPVFGPGEAHIPGGQAQLVISEHTRGHRGGAFAVLFPWARGVDGLAVDLHPPAQLHQEPLVGLVERAVGARRHIEQQIAVLGDDIDQHIHHGVDRAQGLVRLIEPCADRGVVLPGLLLNPLQQPPFHLAHTHAGAERPVVRLRWPLLDVQHRLVPAAVPLGVLVVVPGDHLAPGQAVVVGERQAAVEVDQVRAVLLAEVLDPRGPLVFPGLRCIDRIGAAGCAVRMIELPVLWIGAVVGHALERAFLVGSVGVLEPTPASGQVRAHAEAQAVALAGRPPHANEVFLRPHVAGVPAVVTRIPAVEVVVIHGVGYHVSGPGLLQSPHQIVRVEMLGLPHVRRSDVPGDTC